MNYTLIIALALSSYALRASDSIFTVGQWVNNKPDVCCSVGMVIGLATVCVDGCINSFCTMEPHGTGLNDVIARNMEDSACPQLAPIMEYSPYVAIASFLLPPAAILTANMGTALGRDCFRRLPRRVRRHAEDELAVNCCACCICAAGNALLGEYVHYLYPNAINSGLVASHSGSLGTQCADTIQNVSNVVCPTYATWAPCISACCLLAPSFLAYAAKVGTYYADDADKED